MGFSSKMYHGGEIATRHFLSYVAYLANEQTLKKILHFTSVSST